MWIRDRYFFGEYPSPVHLRGKTAEELAGELRPVSHNNCSVKKAEKILELVRSDGEILRDCQESRDIITRGLVLDWQHYREQMLEVEEAIKGILPCFQCTLMTMPGIDIVTAANIDVYKRQVLDYIQGLDSKGTLKVDDYHIYSLEEIRAVSYTHLDVYKRQIFKSVRRGRCRFR